MATSRGGRPTGQAAQERVQETAQVAQEKVSAQAQQAKGRVRDEVDRRSTQAGQQVSSTAEALRQTSERLRAQGQEPAAKAAERAAQQAEKVGGWLEGSSGEDILEQIEDFGRKEPLAVTAAGVVLGFAAARFLKASSQRRYASRGSSSSPYGAGHALPSPPPAPPDPVGSPLASGGVR
jgi:hypothetical protein